MQCVNLNQETSKRLEILFVVTTKIKKKTNFKNDIAKIKNILKVWRMRELIIERNIFIFKLFAISTFIHLALIKTVSIFTENS